MKAILLLIFTPNGYCSITFGVGMKSSVNASMK